jgi:hypothetical protein
MNQLVNKISLPLCLLVVKKGHGSGIDYLNTMIYDKDLILKRIRSTL